MKIRITILAFMMCIIGYGQIQNSNKTNDDVNIKVEIISLTFTVDSAEDLKSLKLEDVVDIFEISDDNTPISLKIECNGEEMTNGHKSSVSMEVDGNTNELKMFIKKVKKIKNVAINYYKVN